MAAQINKIINQQKFEDLADPNVNEVIYSNIFS